MGHNRAAFLVVLGAACMAGPLHALPAAQKHTSTSTSRGPAQQPKALLITAQVNLTQLAATTDDVFVGINIDSASLERGLNFTNPQLIQLAKRLSPAVLRVGGGEADHLTYAMDSRAPHSAAAANIITGGYWDELLAFVATTQLDLVFDLNCLQKRLPDGSWNATETEQLLAHMRSSNQSVYGFQLGNEPSHFLKRNPTTGPSAQQLARDFAHLRSLLEAAFADQSQNPPRIQGPDLCCGFDYFAEFLAAAKDTVDDVTFHFYPMEGPKASANQTGQCTVANFTDKANLDRSDAVLRIYQDLQQVNAPNANLILGETATTGDGGCPGLSNRFVSGFFWIDQLGRVSRLGLNKIYRQDLVGWSGATATSNYALAGQPGWVDGSNLLTNVHPDYYITLLWKQLMGPRVLDVATPSYNFADLRVYASCGRSATLALAVVNLGAADASVALNFPGSAWAPTARSDWLLSSSPPGRPANLTSNTVYLNGAPLTFASKLAGTPHPGPGLTSITVPAHTYGFVELTGPSVSICDL